MSLSSFSQLSAQFPEPYANLVLHFGELVYQEGRFDNFVIMGEDPGDQEVDCNAWWIFGFMPGYEGILQCRVMDTAAEEERKLWNKRFENIIPLLNSSFDGLPAFFRAQSTHELMDKSQSHVIGLIGFYTAMKSKKEFVVLWKNHKLSKFQAESLMRAVLIEKLGDKSG